MITKLIGYDEIILISNINFSKDSISRDQLLELPLILIDDKNSLDFTLLDEVKLHADDLEKFNIVFSTNSFWSRS